MSKRGSICIEDRCPTPTRPGRARCDGHHAAYAKAHPRGEHHGRRGSTWAWRKTRARVLRRDGHRCTILVVGERCTATATEVDHVLARQHGGTDDETNLRSICHEHHRQKSAADRQAPCPPIREVRGPASAGVGPFSSAYQPLNEKSAADSAPDRPLTRISSISTMHRRSF